MKRVELLEALYLQGKKMRELQVCYFSLRKGGGRFSSPEAKKVLEQSKLAEMEYDKMVKELDEWWKKYGPPAPGGGADLEDGFSAPLELTEDEDYLTCAEIPEEFFDIENYGFPEVGFLVDVFTWEGLMITGTEYNGEAFANGLLDKQHKIVAWCYSETLNDSDDDIRI